MVGQTWLIYIWLISARVQEGIFPSERFAWPSDGITESSPMGSVSIAIYLSTHLFYLAEITAIQVKSDWMKERPLAQPLRMHQHCSNIRPEFTENNSLQGIDSKGNIWVEKWLENELLQIPFRLCVQTCVNCPFWTFPVSEISSKISIFQANFLVIWTPFHYFI